MVKLIILVILIIWATYIVTKHFINRNKMIKSDRRNKIITDQALKLNAIAKAIENNQSMMDRFKYERQELLELRIKIMDSHEEDESVTNELVTKSEKIWSDIKKRNI